MKKNEKKMLLQDKIAGSKRILEKILESHGVERTAVAWTGGKDSTVALWLWRSLLHGQDVAKVRAVNLDTGLKYPEVLALRDQVARDWDIVLHVQRPDVDLEEYPVALDKLTCCRDLKILPLQRAVQEKGFAALITGLRRDEHPSRAGRDYLEYRLDPDHVQVNPLLDWTEMDVWSCIMEHGLPYCNLYNDGYRSLGCMPCTLSPDQIKGDDERSGRNQEKEGQMETLRSLGYF